jgi:hypothetical protein
MPEPLNALKIKEKITLSLFLSHPGRGDSFS